MPVLHNGEEQMPGRHSGGRLNSDKHRVLDLDLPKDMGGNGLLHCRVGTTPQESAIRRENTKRVRDIR